ncbi:HEXXH motif-containing putative peptide modification protein [Stenotrophomonas sp.]|uniref:aKG-HExxH-type peptide beta-hydroxylase n=1 Tax=Stenotrophomonas sp. TaxID=69392 RepID=UPI0031CFAAA8
MPEIPNVIAVHVAKALSFSKASWFPGLSKVLIQAWGDASRADSDHYRASHFVGGPGCHPLWIQTLEAEERKLTCLEVLAPAVEAPYLAQGLSFLSAHEVAESSKAIFHEALSANAIPTSLLASVTDLAKATHWLRSAGEGMDTSHSDPALPFSVFVSVPAVHERFAALRLAEAFIHEAMHLQLSLIERVLPMIHDSELTFYSPWRGGHRSVGGVLHGLYVFAVIYEWLSLRGSACGYAQRRLSEIGEEVSQLVAFADADGLTPAGAQLARSLLDSVLPKPT